MTVYDIVSEKAKEKGLTIQQLEIKAGLGNATIGKWRKNNPSMKSIISVAQALEIPVQDLFVKR